MGPISRWAVRRPLAALVVWLVFAASLIGAGIAFKGEYNDSFELPDTDSSTAEELLTKNSDGEGGSFDARSAKVLVQVTSGSVTDESALADISDLADDLAAIGNVSCVESPLGKPVGDDCSAEAKAAATQRAQQAAQQAKAAEQQAQGSAASPASKEGTDQPQPDPMQEQFAAMDADAQKAASGLGDVGVSPDGDVVYLKLSFAGKSGDFTAEQVDEIYETVSQFNDGDDYRAGLNSQALETAHESMPTSEIFGVIIALIILLAVFGSFVASFLPIVSSVASVMVGQFVIVMIARGMDVASFAPTLAAMIGLGVGIDYALFVLSRFQQDVASGKSPKAAAFASVETAGRAVVFAAITVVIGLLGLLVTGVSFFTGLALAASSTVFLMMIGATFVLPALLSQFGLGVFALRLPWLRNSVLKSHEHGLFAKYGRWLEKHYRWMGALGVLVLIVVAIPAGALRLGFPDASGRDDTETARIAYDLTSEGFAEGINGPLIVTVDASKDPGNFDELRAITDDVLATDGVATAIAVPMKPDAEVGLIQVIPTTGPSQQETSELLARLRDEVLPAATSGSDLTAYVGGATAVAEDFTGVLVGALPMFLTLVVGLGFLMLLFLFRSVLVPFIGAVTSLLSLAAAMGVTVAVFQWGWLRTLLGVTEVGPIMPFLPIMVFAILFGLSMDYQVFLVSRMQEEWDKTGDNAWSIKEGLGSSGRVVAIAAAIMFSVFAAFIFQDNVTIKLFGLALASAVLFDGFVVRLVIVPALMFALRGANWWLPGPLARVLPKFTIETETGHDAAQGQAAQQRAGALAAGRNAMNAKNRPGADVARATRIPPAAGVGLAATKEMKPFMTPPPKQPETSALALGGTRPQQPGRVLALVALGAIAVTLVALAGRGAMEVVDAVDEDVEVS